MAQRISVAVEDDDVLTLQLLASSLGTSPSALASRAIRQALLYPDRGLLTRTELANEGVSLVLAKHLSRPKNRANFFPGRLFVHALETPNAE